MILSYIFAGIVGYRICLLTFQLLDLLCDYSKKEDAVSAETTRLERRFLEETKAHDKTRHRLEARERELERIRSNNYAERVEKHMTWLDEVSGD